MATSVASNQRQSAVSKSNVQSSCDVMNVAIAFTRNGTKNNEKGWWDIECVPLR